VLVPVAGHERTDDSKSERVGHRVSSGIDWNSGGQQPFTRIGLSPADGERSLTRSGAGSGTLRVNLRWNQSEEPRRGGARVLRRRLDPGPSQGAASGPKVDLDLGCLYQFTDGQRGTVQAAGNRNGDFARPPYVRLDRDDRTGSSTGENLFINMDHNAHFQRLLIFVLLAGGADDLTKVGAAVTLYPTSGPALELRLEAPLSGATAGGGKAKSCAAVLIQRAGTEFTLKTEARFFPGFQSEIDKAYSWGLRWAPGPGKVRI
jgi:tellurite resistance protein TerA